MEKEKYKVIEIFNKNGKKADDLLNDIFKIYIQNKLSSYMDLNIKK